MEKDKRLLIVFIIIVIAALFLFNFIKSNKEKDSENQFTYENAVKGNFLIKVKEGYDEEIINLSNLDRFIDNINHGKEDDVYILEYAKKNKSKLPVSLCKATYDGETLKVMNFDFDKGNFIEKGTKDYETLIKTGDNFGARVVGLKSKIQPIEEGDIIFEYVESNVTEAK